MKAFAKLFIIVLVTVTTNAEFVKKPKEDLVKFRTECAAKLNIPQEHQDKYAKFEYPDDEITYKHVRCVAEKFETWDEKEGFHKDLMMIQFGSDKDQILDKCLTKKDEGWSAEKWAWNDWKCLVEHKIYIPK